MDERSIQFFSKVRRALMFSTISTTMRHWNRVYRPSDIAIVAVTLHFICAVLRSCVLVDIKFRTRLHIDYILHAIRRQTLFIVSDCIANGLQMRDVGTQHENTLLLVMSTTSFVALITFIPDWFLMDNEQGSIKTLLVYFFTSRFSQIHIAGLRGGPGSSVGREIGVLLYGLFFSVFNMLDSSFDKESPKSEFVRIMQQAAAMIFSNLFLSQITPEATNQVIPLALLIGMYLVFDNLPMSGAVASFVLWRTAREVSEWTTRLLPHAFSDQILLFSMFLCVLPPLNPKLASVTAVACMQLCVNSIMIAVTSLGKTAALVASFSVLIVADIVLS